MDSNAAGYKIYFGIASHAYTNSVDVGNVTNAAITGLSANTTYYFAATTYDVDGDESDFSDEVAINTFSAPTISPLPNLSLNENAELQTVNLTGITLGTGEALNISAISSNPTLIPNPVVSYSSPAVIGTLTFTPAVNAFGSAIITVTANNGQAQSNLISQAFVVSVAAAQPPTLNALPNLSLIENAGLQMVNLTGISLGTGAALNISATSSNPTLIPSPVVNYNNPNSAGTLTFAPATNAFGSATITVTANNGQSQSNLVSQTFAVSVAAYRPPTLNSLANLSLSENAASETVNLTGISLGTGQTLNFIATSSNPTLIPNPAINYSSPATTGTLTFTPATNTFGTTTITVTANNGQAQSNLVSKTFTVVVAASQPPTLNNLANLSLNEDPGSQTVNLTGISLGTGQTLNITATSSNPTLIPNPVVIYSSPATTGTLTFTPATNVFGTTTITVTANNGQGQSNLVIQTFAVRVVAFQPPTLNSLVNLSFHENAGMQTVNLTGISRGTGQVLNIMATSSNPSLISNPVIMYNSPATAGTLTFTPLTNAFGSAIITVTANNGQAQSNLVTQTFTVNVVPYQPPTLNAPANESLIENAGPQTVNLTGISLGTGQALNITATSSNPSLIPKPVVMYSSPATAGTLTFTSLTNAFGSAIITVTANNGQAQSNLVTQTFSVNVAPYQPPTLNALANLSLNENAGSQAVNLTGISLGTGQLLKITATSSNPSLIPNPVVNYSSPAAVGTLAFTPGTNLYGTAIITVKADNGLPQSNLVTQTFIVIVAAVNQAPTLNPVADLTLNYNSPAQVINLSGISSGAPNENQTLKLSATSSNIRIVTISTLNYTSPQPNGTLTISPVANTNGIVTITVSVNDGGKSNNVTARTFTVTVLPRVVKPVVLNALTNCYALVSNTVSFNVLADGLAPLNFQWKHNGTNVSGATNSLLTLKNITAKEAGAYYVTVSNSVGNTNSTVATLTVVSEPTAVLNSGTTGNGQFSFDVIGVTGNMYAVQATSDLIHWVAVQTNTAPFSFVESNASQFNQRFYRTVNLP